MTIITKKVTLHPAPFVGTRIRIELDDPESLTWGMGRLTPADGRGKAVIDWGDGVVEDVTGPQPATHAYSGPGEYEVRVSDDISTIQCSSIRTSVVFRSVYAPMIREFTTNARALENLDSGCLAGAVNMRAVRCTGVGLRKLGPKLLDGCDSLPERLDFPHVVDIASTAFVNAPRIAELHFSAENFEAIRALDGFDTCFGATNAILSFDL